MSKIYLPEKTFEFYLKRGILTLVDGKYYDRDGIEIVKEAAIVDLEDKKFDRMITIKDPDNGPEAS